MTTLHIGFASITCCHKGCGAMFAFPTDLYDRLRNSGEWWYCPFGHSQHFTSESSDASKLDAARAREMALRDQLEASIRDAENVRRLHARDRQRIANGACPCCNRYFDNVRRHMVSKHPDYDAPEAIRSPKFECGCGRSFESYHGLRIHQGYARSTDWAKPGKPSWQSHLTVGASR